MRAVSWEICPVQGSCKIRATIFLAGFDVSIQAREVSMSPVRPPHSVPRRRETVRLTPIDPTIQTDSNATMPTISAKKKRAGFDPYQFLKTIGMGRTSMPFQKKQTIFVQGDL